MSLKVLSPGLHTLFVGEPRTAAYAEPGSAGRGAADRFSLAIGNGLVGNLPDAVALECNLAGPVLEAQCPLTCVLSGALFQVESARGRERTGFAFNLEPGDIVRIGGCEQGARAYLCVPGGFESSLVLDSRSGLTPIKAGQELVCKPGQVAVRPGGKMGLEQRSFSSPFRGRSPARWFQPEQFISQAYSIGSASNRMGLRLAGNGLICSGGEIASEPVCPGTVQVTRDGQCIILGADSQTIGGYPKIAQVIAADLDKLGQLRGLAIRSASSVYRWRMRNVSTEPSKPSTNLAPAFAAGHGDLKHHVVAGHRRNNYKRNIGVCFAASFLARCN